MSEYNTILVEQRGAVTLVTLNRPQALNALNSEVLKELIDAFAAYDADESQRCLVLTGSGDKAFAAGADIKEMQPQGFAEMYSSNFFGGWEQVTATRKPWIAAVAGYALGGGCEVAMMADFIIAADTAKFGQPEIKLAVTPGMDRARDSGAARVHLEVRDGNPAAAMYRAAGFSPVGRRRNYYQGEDGQRYDALTFDRNL